MLNFVSQVSKKYTIELLNFRQKLQAKSRVKHRLKGVTLFETSSVTGLFISWMNELVQVFRNHFNDMFEKKQYAFLSFHFYILGGYHKSVNIIKRNKHVYLKPKLLQMGAWRRPDTHFLLRLKNLVHIRFLGKWQTF